MPTLQTIAVVPAASRPAVEAAIAPYLLSATKSGEYTFSVALSADGSFPATHYGTCAPCPDDGLMVAALPGLVAAFPGSSYHTVSESAYSRDTHWTAWLAGLGLQRVSTGGGL